MEHPNHVWDSTEPDRKRVEDEKRTIRPAADPVILPKQVLPPKAESDPQT